MASMQYGSRPSKQCLSRQTKSTAAFFKIVQLAAMITSLTLSITSITLPRCQQLFHIFLKPNMDSYNTLYTDTIQSDILILPFGWCPRPHNSYHSILIIHGTTSLTNMEEAILDESHLGTSSIYEATIDELVQDSVKNHTEYSINKLRLLSQKWECPFLATHRTLSSFLSLWLSPNESYDTWCVHLTLRVVHPSQPHPKRKSWQLRDEAIVL